MRTRRNRITLIAALMAGALGGAASAHLWPGPASASAAPAPTPSLTSITARQFEVMDDQGNERAKLSVSPEGTAQLAMYDQQGVERALLAVTREGTTMLAMSGDDGKPRMAANVVMHDGPAAFALLNPDSTTAAELIVNKDKRALLLADHKGNARVRLDLDAGEKGEAALTFYDKDGKPLKKLP